MTAFFNLPYNATNFVQIMQYNNTITNDMFGISILAMVFFISFITMLNFGQKQSLMASMWLTASISVLLWVMQLISPSIMTALVVIMAVGSIFLFRTREN